MVELRFLLCELRLVQRAFWRVIREFGVQLNELMGLYNELYPLPMQVGANSVQDAAYSGRAVAYS